MEFYSWIIAAGFVLGFEPGPVGLPEEPCLCAPQTAIAWPAGVPSAPQPIPARRAVPHEETAPAAEPPVLREAAFRDAATATDAPAPFPAPALDAAAAPSPHATGPHALPYPTPTLATPSAAEPPGAVASVPDLRLHTFGDADFVEDRAQLIDQLGPDNREAVILDLAALHIAHGLHLEAKSYLSSLAPTDPAAEMTHRALARLAGSFGRTGGDAAGDLPATWPLLPLLDIIDAPEAEHSDETLVRAAEALDELSPTLQAQALPNLLAVAVSRELWREAHDLAKRFADHPEIANGSAFHYLLGQVAEAGDEHVAAFDSYRRAAEGRDLWAQRARLALVDLGQRTGTLSDAEVAELLTQAATLWRGDATGRATREALAEARIAAGDRPGAVAALAEVFRAHPRSMEAQKARLRANELLDEIYTAGTAGELSLARFMDLHRTLSTDLRFEAAFHTEAERFADHLLDLGMTASAAEEYGRLADLVEVAAEVDPAADDPARRARLQLRKAEALVEGGQAAQAAPLLAEGPGALQEDLRPRFDALRAEVMRATGDTDGLLSTGPAPELLRLKADALFDDGQWGRASDFYDQLWSATGEIAPGLAPRMALAAHRAGYPDRVEDIVEALPKLEDTPAWAEIAREVANPAERSPVLRLDVVQRDLESAARVAERSGRVRAQPPDEPEL